MRPKVLIKPSRTAGIPTIRNDSRETRSKSAQEHQYDAPIQFQIHQRLFAIWRHNGKAVRSPTHSIESFGRWASRESNILIQQHKTHPPTHTAVAKFQTPIPVGQQKRIQTRIRQSLKNESKRTGCELSVYYKREIEPSNCVHYHFLIRTIHPRVASVMRRILAKASNGTLHLQYCRRVKSVKAITLYITKNLRDVRSGDRKHLLFVKKLGIHHSGGWNGYFTKTKREHWEEWKHATFGNSENSEHEKHSP